MPESNVASGISGSSEPNERAILIELEFGVLDKLSGCPTSVASSQTVIQVATQEAAMSTDRPITTRRAFGVVKTLLRRLLVLVCHNKTSLRM